jgi:hypothetical protein
MSLDDIDIDSWTESEEKAPLKGPAKPPTGTTKGPAKGKAKGPTKGNTGRSGDANKAPPDNRESVISRPSDSPATIPVKILDDAVLLASIEKSSFNMEGEQYFRNWVTRKLQKGDPKYSTGKARTAVLAYLVKIYRQLKNEGYE